MTEATSANTVVTPPAANTPAENPELKAALAAAKESADAVKAMSAQMKEMQEKLAAIPVTEKVTPKAKVDDLSTLMYTDPEEYTRVLKEQLREESRAEQATTRAQEAFWDEFYKENKDLKEFSGYVEFVFQRELPGFLKKNNTVGDSIKELGEAVKKEVLKMKGGKNKSGGDNKIEGGSERNSDGNTESESDVSKDSPTTTEQILAERKAARRKAQAPGRT
jgi:hypothetical protein